jgi:hypothetical protein
MCNKGIVGNWELKDTSKRWIPQAQYFWITIHELVLAKDNDGFSPPTHIHTTIYIQNSSIQMSLIIKPRYLGNVNSISFSYT